MVKAVLASDPLLFLLGIINLCCSDESWLMGKQRQVTVISNKLIYHGLSKEPCKKLYEAAFFGSYAL
jgi:hypothetical protein